MTNNDIDIQKIEHAFLGYLKIDRYHLRHRRFDGGWTPVITREVMERGHAVAVLPYDPVSDYVVLQKQFRIAAHAGGFPAWQIEIPAGIIEPNETEEDVARREAKEESGSDVGQLFPICKYLTSTGCTSESLMVYCGLVDSRLAGGIHGLADEHEDIQVLPMPRAQALDLLEQGKIANAVTIIALQWLALRRAAWFADQRDRILASRNVSAS